MTLYVQNTPSGKDDSHERARTVSLSRVWSIDEMNLGNDYHSSPDLYMGNQKAQKIEKFN